MFISIPYEQFTYGGILLAGAACVWQFEISAFIPCGGIDVHLIRAACYQGPQQMKNTRPLECFSYPLLVLLNRVASTHHVFSGYVIRAAVKVQPSGKGSFLDDPSTVPIFTLE